MSRIEHADETAVSRNAKAAGVTKLQIDLAEEIARAQRLGSDDATVLAVAHLIALNYQSEIQRAKL